MGECWYRVVRSGSSLWSAWTANRTLRWERDSAESARRSAEAAERANLLTERLLSREGVDVHGDGRRPDDPTDFRVAIDSHMADRAP